MLQSGVTKGSQQLIISFPNRSDEEFRRESVPSGVRGMNIPMQSERGETKEEEKADLGKKGGISFRISQSKPGYKYFASSKAATLTCWSVVSKPNKKKKSFGLTGSTDTSPRKRVAATQWRSLWRRRGHKPGPINIYETFEESNNDGPRNIGLIN